MSDTATNQSGKEQFEFDVIVSMPLGVEREILEKNAIEKLGVTPEVVATLMKSLVEHRIVKIKSGVSREQADEAADRFSRAGFRVEVNHSLVLQKVQQKGDDGTTTCPACDKAVVLSPDRQCPKCGVFIDKLTPEFLLRKQLMEKERARLAAMQRIEGEDAAKKRMTDLERKLREEIRVELEKEFGLEKSSKSLFSGKLGRYALPAIVTLGIAGSFAAGRALAPGGGAGIGQNATAKSAESTEGQGAGAQKVVENFLKGSAKMGAAMAKNGGGISMSAIIAEAQKGQPGQPGQPVDISGSLAVGDSDGVGAKLAGSDSLLLLLPNIEEKAASAISADAKRTLAMELAVVLAEMGQIPRARELMARAYVLSGETPTVAQAVLLRLAHLRVEAWAIGVGQGAKLSEQIDALDKLAGELPTAGARAEAFAAIGEVLSGTLNLKSEVAEAFFHRASQEFAKETSKSVQNDVGRQLLVSRAQAVLNAVRVRVEHGMLDGARQLATQLEGMTASAPTVTSAMLMGIDGQVKGLLGNATAALKTVEAALAKAHRASSIEEESNIIRRILQSNDVYASEKGKSAVSVVVASAEKRGGRELAGVLVEVAQIHAQNGNVQAVQEAKAKLDELAKTKPGLEDYVGQLAGLSEVAFARHARKTGALADSDAHLRRAAALIS